MDRDIDRRIQLWYLWTCLTASALSSPGERLSILERRAFEFLQPFGQPYPPRREDLIIEETRPDEISDMNNLLVTRLPPCSASTLDDDRLSAGGIGRFVVAALDRHREVWVLKGPVALFVLLPA